MFLLSGIERVKGERDVEGMPKYESLRRAKGREGLVDHSGAAVKSDMLQRKKSWILK